MEFCKIKGVSEHRRRELGVNLTGGGTNALEITKKIFGAPPIDQILKDFCEVKGYPLPDELGGDEPIYVERETLVVPLEEEGGDDSILD